MKIRKYLLLILVVLISPIIVNADDNWGTTDNWDYDGNDLAIVTSTPLYQGSEYSYMALTDSYNDEYKSDGNYNTKRIGGKKILYNDLNTTDQNNITTTDNGVTFWHFEAAKEYDLFDKSGNSTSTLNGRFKMYYIYTIDSNNKKHYLNLNNDYTMAEISDTKHPVAVTKVNNSNYIILWGLKTLSGDIKKDSLFDKNNVNYLIPNLSVNKKTYNYNTGLFGGSKSFKTDGTRYFYLVKPGFEKRTLSRVPKIVDVKESFPGKIKVFDYSEAINNYGAGLNGFKFYNGNNTDTPLQIAKDGYGFTYSSGNLGAVQTNYTVEKTLGNDGYPVTNLGSLNYLFDDSKVPGKTIAGTAEESGYLFQKNGDDYYYDSEKNAAYFDGNKFTLYDSIIRPEYTPIEGISSSGKVDYSADVRKGNFLPFNKVDSTTLSPYNILTTKKGVTSYKLSGKNDGVVDLWFGLELDSDLKLPKDYLKNDKPAKFSYKGDDAILMYLDNVLILNYNGIDNQYEANGYVDFKNGDLYDSIHKKGETNLFDVIKESGVEEVDGKPILVNGKLNQNVKHHLKFFFVERGGNLSALRIEISFPSEVKKNIVETKVNPNTEASNIMPLFISILSLGIIIISGLKIKQKNNI